MDDKLPEYPVPIYKTVTLDIRLHAVKVKCLQYVRNKHPRLLEQFEHEVENSIRRANGEKSTRRNRNGRNGK